MTGRSRDKLRPRISVQLPEDLEAALIALAAQEGEALAVVVRRLLRIALRADAAARAPKAR